MSDIHQGPNTYVLEPKEEEKFYPCKVKELIKKVMEERLSKEVYDVNNAPNLSEELSRLIREKVCSNLRMPRYKLCFQVVLGELKGQGIRVTSKCLWDPNFDNFASYTYQNESIYAVGICFGCYYE